MKKTDDSRVDAPVVMKFTIVSIWHKGQRHSFTLDCEIVDGKAKITRAQLSDMLNAIGYKPGDVYALGM